MIDAESDKVVSDENMGNACTIRVEILVSHIVGKVKRRLVKVREHAVPDARPFHEDSKPAILGLSAL